ncbi:MAG: heme lyase CcmF/NrfE family subunit [Actinomycetota bacterium]|nr:heme lyase CcmF/NrfE family subunit [Actinomycetota bacterium]
MRSLGMLGRPALLCALLAATGALVLFFLGARKDRRDLSEAAARALAVTAAFTSLAAAALITALFAHDFSLAYVVNYSSRSLAGPYTISALWGGMEGSLLFWTLLLTLFSTVAIRGVGSTRPVVVAWAGFVLAGISAFFLLLLVVPADPFVTMAEIPADGRGLNPLLQSPGMLIHPPLLYTGFVGFSIPFAWAMGALLSGHADSRWFASTRRWTLFAWSALSIGIVLGGAWAYTELGWGGYWAWDPVENASFMPWLTATAYLHSVVIQEKRQMLKVWNVALILATYVLAVFGTFLTRSGILSSIHTFTEGDTGIWFLPFLAAMLLAGLSAIALRLDHLKSDNRLDALVSRESAFLANNVLFVAAAFTVLWGTVYPIIAEVVTGARLSVGPAFFNAVFAPLGLAIVALTGIGPLLSWRRMSKGALRGLIRPPAITGSAVAVGLAVAGVRSVGALLAFGLCAFTATAIAGEFVRGSRVYRSRHRLGWGPALVRTLMRNRRRYGGYVVHLGVLLIVIGFAGSAFKIERNAFLKPGETMEVGAYSLTYEGLRQERTPEKQINEATVIVRRGDSRLGAMRPQSNFHFAQRQPQSEVAIRTTPVDDLYVVVTQFDSDGSAAIRSFVNPLTWWIWAGAAVMALGMGVLLSGGKGERAPAGARSSVRETVAVPG